MQYVIAYTKKYALYVIITLLGIIVVLGTLFLTRTEPVLAEPEEKQVFKEEKTNSKIKVEVKGAVNNPGVYELELDNRVIDAINSAGGLREDANTSVINLSKKLTDEMVIIIYTNDEIANYEASKVKTEYVYIEVDSCPDKVNNACINEYQENKPDSNESTKDNLVNLNTASITDLTSLPGIGEAKAESIIEYRNKQKFNSIEDVKNISGIGASLFEKIKDHITV